MEDDAADQPSSDGQHLADTLAMAFTLGRRRNTRRAAPNRDTMDAKPPLLRRLFGRQRQGAKVAGPATTVPPAAQDMSQ